MQALNIIIFEIIAAVSLDVVIVNVFVCHAIWVRIWIWERKSLLPKYNEVYLLATEKLLRGSTSLDFGTSL